MGEHLKASLGRCGLRLTPSTGFVVRMKGANIIKQNTDGAKRRC